jgi:hypothetical protein
MVPGREGLADNLMIRTEMRYMHITGGSDGAQRDEGGRHARGALRRRLHGFPIAAAKFCTPDNIALFDKHLECLEKRGDTVGEPISTPYSCDCCVGFSRLLYLQHRHRRGLIFGTGEFANSIRGLNETPREAPSERLILDSRVVIGQIWRNRLFLKDFHGGRDQCDFCEKSRLISGG